MPLQNYTSHTTRGDAIPMLMLFELQSIIDTRAAFMDVENAQGEGPAFRKALQNITSRLESTHVQDIVKTALSRM